MKTFLRELILCVAIFLLSIAVNSAAENAGESNQSVDIQVEIKDGLLSLNANNAPLDKIIHKIGAYAGFKTILADDFDQPPEVSISFNGISVERAVERLISDKNRIIFYTPEENKPQQPVISQVWLLGAGDISGHSEFKDDQVDASDPQNTLTEHNVVDHKLDKLTRILQQDQQVQVRTMAATALGALQDERAIPSLESALLDQHSSVRMQAISALARVGGERVTMVLGNLLLNTGVDTAERVLAAKALWQQDTGTARRYLQAGTYDKVDQVRLASSKPGSLPELGANNKQIGSTATQ